MGYATIPVHLKSFLHNPTPQVTLRANIPQSQSNRPGSCKYNSTWKTPAEHEGCLDECSWKPQNREAKAKSIAWTLPSHHLPDHSSCNTKCYPNITKNYLFQFGKHIANLNFGKLSETEKLFILHISKNFFTYKFILRTRRAGIVLPIWSVLMSRCRILFLVIHMLADASGVIYHPT